MVGPFSLVAGLPGLLGVNMFYVCDARDKNLLSRNFFFANPKDLKLIVQFTIKGYGLYSRIFHFLIGSKSISLRDPFFSNSVHRYLY